MIRRLIFVFLLLGCLPVAFSQLPDRLRDVDRWRIHEARRLKQAIGDKIWPGWAATPFTLLLVSGEREFLLYHPRPSQDFQSAGHDSLLQTEVFTRPRQFRADFLATFPAVGGVQTIVVGTPERTGLTSTAWIVTLLHEHFHQYQYTRTDYYPQVERLNLAGGDQTGMWMLDFPFPYERNDVAQQLEVCLRALEDAMLAQRAKHDYLAEKKKLQCLLSAKEYRYMNFQLWQEGLSRYTEIAVAEFAAAHHRPDARVTALDDYVSYAHVAANLRAGVRRGLTDVAAQKRVLFYSLGAAEALLLDATLRPWRERYFDAYFDTDRLFEYVMD